MSRNSVGVSSALSPSTYAWTLRGSSRSSSTSISSPRRGSCARVPRRAAAADARGELLHRERLDEVVVGAELERVDPVVLGAARADDDDRRADPLAARLLDHAPAVDAGEHQVEHADVGLLVAEPGEPGLAVRDADGVEAGGGQVPRHALGDDVVVLDDQHLRHACIMQCATGCRGVKEW